MTAPDQTTISRRTLGAGDHALEVSALGLGCMGLSFGFGPATERGEAVRLIRAAHERGVTFFDTAEAYGQGENEDVVREALAPVRDRVVIATKFAGPMGKREDQKGGSRRYVMQAVEASLKRLGTDYIDLYQMHFPDAATPIEETLSALDDLVRAGKVRYVGCSNFSGWQMSKALGVSERLRLARYVSQQVYYSLQSRDAEYEIVPASLDQGVGILVWSPLAGGLLSGKYRRGQQGPEGARHLTDWNEPPVRDEEQTYDLIEAAVEIGEERGVSAAQVALAYTLGWPTADTELIFLAARLHDVGKLAVPDAILHKPGRLTDAEYRLVQTHTEVGALILSQGQTPLLQLAEEVALSHHERWDGFGYPHGLSGERIPLEARLLGVADAFDAMTSARAYRPALSVEQALVELERCAGSQFDPELAQASVDGWRQGEIAVPSRPVRLAI